MPGIRAHLTLRYLIYAVVIGTGIALFEVLLFSSVSSKQKYVLYKLQLLILAYVLLYFISWSLWRKLCPLMSNTVFPSYACKCWKAVVVGYIGLGLLAPLYSYYVTKEPSPLGLIAWVCLGSGLVLDAMMNAVRMSVNGFRLLVRGGLSHSEVTYERRQALVCVTLTALITWSAYHTATSPPTIVRESVPMRKLPRSLDGTRIVLLSDIHLGPTAGFTILERAVRMTNSLNPDLVIIAGDLADGPVKDLREAAIALMDLAAPRGCYFVTGNHEYYTHDVEAWFEFLGSIGFHVLHNGNVKIRAKDREDDWFCLLGTDDLQANRITYEDHGMNLSKAFEGCDYEHAAVLVAHQPNAAKIALDSKYPINLVLSGHTHGGQFFPITLFAYAVNAFLAGLYKYDSDSYVYVSQGTMYYAFPLRFWTRPEITEITLLST